MFCRKCWFGLLCCFVPQLSMLFCYHICPACVILRNYRNNILFFCYASCVWRVLFFFEGIIFLFKQSKSLTNCVIWNILCFSNDVGKQKIDHTSLKIRFQLLVWNPCHDFGCSLQERFYIASHLLCQHSECCFQTEIAVSRPISLSHKSDSRCLFAILEGLRGRTAPWGGGGVVDLKRPINVWIKCIYII